MISILIMAVIILPAALLVALALWWWWYMEARFWEELARDRTRRFAKQVKELRDEVNWWQDAQLEAALDHTRETAAKRAAIAQAREWKEKFIKLAAKYSAQGSMAITRAEDNALVVSVTKQPDSSDNKGVNELALGLARDQQEDG